MDNKNNAETIFLMELYRQTDGNTTAQVTMLDVGAAVGLEKNEAEETAEDLIISGFVELKTLSGGIGITQQGLEKLDLSPANDRTEDDLQLGRGPVLDNRGRNTIEVFLEEIKTGVTQIQTDYPSLEGCIIDIKTLEVQLLSPSPKVGIIREILKSLSTTVSELNRRELANKLKKILGS